MFGIEDPNALLRPWANLKQFSEELFAMLGKVGGPEQASNQSSEARQAKAGEPARQRSDDTPGATQPDRRGDRSQPPSVAITNEVRATRVEQARQRTQPDLHGEDKPRPQPEPYGESRTSPLPDPYDLAAKRNLSDYPYEAIKDRGQPEPYGEPTPRPQPEPYEKTKAPVPVGSNEPRATSSAAPEPWEPSRVSGAPPAAPETKDDQGASQSPSSQPPNQSEDWQGKRSHRQKINWTKVPFGNTATFTANSDSATTFMGQVVSGTGSSYQVNLYSNGPTDVVDDNMPITVTIPTIDPNETIAKGTWLAPIFQFSDSNGNPIYSCQPPVWMP